MADSEINSRKFFVTVHLKNMVNMGFDEKDYMQAEILADYLLSTWEESKDGRKGACAVCESKDGLYHAHLALYSKSKMRPLAVAKMFGNAHTEIVYGSKEQLKQYILKEGKYKDKEEKVLYAKGIETFDNQKDIKNDFEYALKMLSLGKTLNEIYKDDISLVRFDKNLREAFYHIRKNNVPLFKDKADMMRVWHFGLSHTGKSYTYKKIVEEVGADKVFLVTGSAKNGFDNYMADGAPPILFIDELRHIPYATLLNILGYFTRTTIDCRFSDAFAFWNEVHITSVYSPDALHKLIVPFEERDTDSFDQLRNRLEKIVYHYKDSDGNYCTYEVEAKDYVNEAKFMNDFYLSNSSLVAYESADKHLHNPFRGIKGIKP